MELNYLGAYETLSLKSRPLFGGYRVIETGLFLLSDNPHHSIRFFPQNPDFNRSGVFSSEVIDAIEQHEAVRAYLPRGPPGADRFFNFSAATITVLYSVSDHGITKLAGETKNRL